MEIIQSVSELRRFRQKQHNQLVIVPTMGALHEGHCALIRQARSLVGSAGSVLVSIFVNPIQFDRPEDLESYPVKQKEDHAICKKLGVDAIFTPSRFYHNDRSINITENSLSKTLCGSTRPGHFDGVCTVVAKLFLSSQAEHAVFGKKDYQQLAIIRRMVRDLDLAITIHGAETIREPSGLAMSSRNLRLTPLNYSAAPILRQALLEAKSLSHQHSVQSVLDQTYATITSSAVKPTVDYLELVDAETLAPTKNFTSPCVLATAVFFGEVRLIDNIEISSQPS